MVSTRIILTLASSHAPDLISTSPGFAAAVNLHRPSVPQPLEMIENQQPYQIKVFG